VFHDLGMKPVVMQRLNEGIAMRDEIGKRAGNHDPLGGLRQEGIGWLRHG
jgi:hypothetical protein